MNIDFWYGHTLNDVSYFDTFFYPNEGIFRGNMYDANRKVIGEYSCKESCKILETFCQNVD